MTVVGRLGLAGLLGGVILTSSIPAASAQLVPVGDGRLQLTTSPLPINLITEPGNIISTELRIQNNGPTTERLKISLLKFDAFGELGQPRLIEPTPQDTHMNWVSFSEPEFTVVPGQWKSLTATFNVPTDAAFGYYYAVVFSRVAETPQPGVTAVIGGTAILVLLEARVPGARREIAVDEFSVDKAWYEFLPVTFRVKLQNSGNVHVAPRGNIFIDRGSTSDVGIIEVNFQKGNILPGSTRLFEALWEDGFPVYKKKIENDRVVTDAEGVAELDLTWDFSQAHKLRWGRYTATMLLVYDDGQRDVPIEGKVSFWVIPWRMVLVLLVVALLVLMGMWGILRGVFRRATRERRY
ncbi:MAG: hypothetical protein WD972_00225 [Candidatus Andersenbacteria bacterium]